MTSDHRQAEAEKIARQLWETILDADFCDAGFGGPLSMDTLSIRERIAAALIEAEDRGAQSERAAWRPIETPPKTGDIIIGLAHLLGFDPSAAHPMIVQWHEYLGWEQVTYTGQTPRPIAVIAWRPRPEFIQARHRILRATATFPDHPAELPRE